jgi:hypothetical protein
MADGEFMYTAVFTNELNTNLASSFDSLFYLKKCKFLLNKQQILRSYKYLYHYVSHVSLRQEFKTRKIIYEWKTICEN